jgi:hypothetical protein
MFRGVALERLPLPLGEGWGQNAPGSCSLSLWERVGVRPALGNGSRSPLEEDWGDGAPVSGSLSLLGEGWGEGCPMKHRPFAEFCA